MQIFGALLDHCLGIEVPPAAEAAGAGGGTESTHVEVSLNTPPPVFPPCHTPIISPCMTGFFSLLFSILTSRTPLKTKATSPSKWPNEVYLYATHTHKPEALYWDLHLEREPFLRWTWRQAAQISSSSSYSTYEGGGNGILLLVKNTSTWNLSGLNYCISYYVYSFLSGRWGVTQPQLCPPPSPLSPFGRRSRVTVTSFIRMTVTMPVRKKTF